MDEQQRVVGFDHLRMTDVERVGGKNASLGEMISELRDSGIRVPGGFATTAFAFREFLRTNGLKQRIDGALDALDVDDVTALSRAGAEIRGWIAAAPLPKTLEVEIGAAYKRSVRTIRRGQCRGPLVGDRRGSARRLVCRPAGYIPQYQWLGEHSSRGKGSFCLALQRPRDRLSRPPGLRARRSRALGGRAAHGAQRHRRRRA